MTIDEILRSPLSPEEKMAALKMKIPTPPVWEGDDGLESEFDPRKHPVMNRGRYPDIVTEEGVQPVTRVTFDLQRLAAKRMAELVCGIPVKRVYKPENDRQSEVAAVLEAVYERNRIDSVNIERCNMLFAGCEVITLWYAVEQPNTQYGVASEVKVRCRNFSPMQGDRLFPLFDEYGDLTAMSVAYTRRIGAKNVEYFIVYTSECYIKWSTESGEWAETESAVNALGKIPAVYVWRPSPVWENTSDMVYEMEWALSRNGNYLRENSKPLFAVFADNEIEYGTESRNEYRSVLQFPQGSTAQYITWPQAVDNLKFYVEQLRSLFFTQLQLPDWSYERMSQQALSGESRKQMFIDAQLKVKDESGRLIEFFDRETNVLKAFARVILGEAYAADIAELSVEHVITPFAIDDEADTIKNLTAANGGKAIISQRESIELYGHSKDVDKTMADIAAENAADAFQPESAL